MDEFKEVSENYTLREAIREAQRCLHCKVPSCRKGCPISNDMPDWIAELAKGNFGNALNIIHNRSNLPAVCGRVCAHERQCEGNCVLAKKGAHINIGKLERFVADFDTDAGLSHEAIPEKSRGRVAVIGSGPAGLTIAGDLARQGFAVEIFEMEPEPGGVLMFGIPEYRLPKEVVRHEIEKIERLGVIFHLGTTIGKFYTIDNLFERGFDAIFMGTGTGKPKAVVPDVMTYDLAIAQDEITARGFKVSVSYETSTMDYGTVINQHPKSPARLDVGSTVYLTVASDEVIPTANYKMRVFFTEKMQSSGDTYQIVVQLDGREVYSSIIDPAEQRAVTVPLNGEGQSVADVYINESLYQSIRVDFDDGTSSIMADRSDAF